MIIFLYGPDTYRRQQKLNDIISDYKKKHSGLSVENFYLASGNSEETELAKLKDFARSRNLFDDLRLGVIRSGFDLDKGAKKDYINILKENISSKEVVFLIIEEKKPAKDFIFLLNKPVLSQEFDHLTGVKLKKFLQKEAVNRGVSLDAESQELLARVYASDIWGLVTELDKLALLDEKSINLKILKSHLNVSLPVNVFNLINQMRSLKNKGARLSLLEELMAKSQDPAMIFNILAIYPYGDRRWKKRAADCDVLVKSGKLEYEEALLEMVLQ
jgi:DNA polymerase III delta subunit